MNSRICRGCGEPIAGPGNVLSRNPNVCASCSSMANGMDQPNYHSITSFSPPPVFRSSTAEGGLPFSRMPCNFLSHFPLYGLEASSLPAKAVERKEAMRIEKLSNETGNPTKNQGIGRPPRASGGSRLHGALRRLAPLVPLAALGLCSCRSVTYDMRRLEQPIVLNNNPSLAGNAPASFEVLNVDRYSATVSDAEVVASSGNAYATTTTTQRTAANDAQVSAFRMIGGQTNRVIRGLTLEADSLAVNGLLVLADKVSVEAAGDVAELRWTSATNTPLTTGKSKP